MFDILLRSSQTQSRVRCTAAMLVYVLFKCKREREAEHLLVRMEGHNMQRLNVKGEVNLRHGILNSKRYLTSKAAHLAFNRLMSSFYCCS